MATARYGCYGYPILHKPAGDCSGGGGLSDVSITRRRLLGRRGRSRGVICRQLEPPGRCALCWQRREDDSVPRAGHGRRVRDSVPRAGHESLLTRSQQIRTSLGLHGFRAALVPADSRPSRTAACRRPSVLARLQASPSPRGLGGRVYWHDSKPTARRRPSPCQAQAVVSHAIPCLPSVT